MIRRLASSYHIRLSVSVVHRMASLNNGTVRLVARLQRCEFPASDFSFGSLVALSIEKVTDMVRGPIVGSVQAEALSLD